MIKKFKHYATDEIIELDVINSTVVLNSTVYNLREFNDDIIIKGTSWILLK